jgi:hypothetical protein
MQKLQIPKNRMNYLIKQIQQYFVIATIESGWELYHKGRLMEIRMEEMNVYANIKGGGTYEVHLNLENFSRSSCSCTSSPYCNHMAAVFFILYSPYGRPELLLQQLKQVMYVKNKTLQTSGKASSSSATPTAPFAIHSDMLPVEWQRYFETKFHGFSISHQHSIELFYQSVTTKLPEYAVSWPLPLKQIYELHTACFVLRKVEQFYIESKNSYLSAYHENGCKLCVKDCLKTITQLLEHIDPASFANYEPHWLETLEWVSDIGLLGKVSPVDWLSIYRMMWWKVKGQHSWIEQEVVRMESLLVNKELTASKRDVLLLARAHFEIIQSQPDQAFARLKQIHLVQPADFFFYIQAYAVEQAWNEMLSWLRWLLPYIAKANQEDFRTYCQHWLDIITHLPTDQEWVDVMDSLLPRSYYFYTAYLLKSKRYQSWVDLQLSNRISPLSLYAIELTAVEQEDQTLLLPLYHQATERAILEKNRNSYKVAMRLLSQMRDYYTQLQQTDRWELYIYKLADKFSRLRSFQDELKKGNWIR